MRAAMFAFLALIPIQAHAGDGCSFGQSAYFRSALGVPPPWERCCDVHDLAYSSGGTEFDRWRADDRLASCVAQTAPPMATIMWLAVRIGGHPFFSYKEPSHAKDRNGR